MLDKRMVEDVKAIVSWLEKQYWDRVTSWISGRLRNARNGKEVTNPCWQAELSSFTCSIAFSKLFPVVMGITAAKELTSACMSVVTGFAVLDMEPATKLLLTIVSATLCNYMVAEALPVLPCLSEVVCNWVRDKFPASKCEGLRHHRQLCLHIKPKVRCIIRLEDHC